MQTPSEIVSTGIAIIPKISARGSDATHSVKGLGRGSSGFAAMGRSPIRSPPTLGFAGLIRSVRGRVRRDSKRLTTKGDARLRRLTAPPSNPKAPAVCRMPHRRDRPACRNFAGRSPRLTFQVVGQSRDDVLTVVQAGGHHPGSQRRPTFIIRKPHQAFCDCSLRISCFLQTRAHAPTPLPAAVSGLSRSRRTVSSCTTPTVSSWLKSISRSIGPTRE